MKKNENRRRAKSGSGENLGREMRHLAKERRWKKRG
jgi:hypothetical protein